MKRFAVSSRTRALPLALFVLLLMQFQAGCGNEDYQKPIKQFQDASAVVISAARQTLLQMNDVEENAELSRQIFQGEAFDEQKIKARDVITHDEIAARTGALDQLARYTSALADLAALKTPADVTKQFQDVGSAFATLAQDAGKLSGTGSLILDNAKFSGAVQAASLGIGTIVRAIEERRARREIEKQIREQDAAVTSLIGLIGDELQAAYERRKTADGQEGVILKNSLKLESEKPGHGDPALRLILGDRLRDWRSHQAPLATADPKPSVEAMNKSHQALVAYVNSDKSPKNLSELIAAAQDFASRVQPLGESLAALLKG